MKLFSKSLPEGATQIGKTTFVKFATVKGQEVIINLKQVHTVRIGNNPDETKIYTPFEIIQVKIPLEDIIQLIQTVGN